MRMLKVLYISLSFLAILLFPDIASAASFPLSPPDSSFFNPDNYRSYCSLNAFAKYDNVASRFNFATQQPSLDFDFGLPSRKSSFSPLAHAGELKDSLKAVSKLYFSLGTKREQTLFLDHIQRLSKSVRLFVNYHNLVSEGFYKNSFARNKNFLIGADMNSRAFDCLGSFGIHKSEFNEFGGINDSSDIEGLAKGDLAQLGVFLTGDKRVNKESVFSYSQRVLLYGDKINLAGINVNLNSSFNYLVSKSSYTGEGTSAFYDAVLLDSSATADTVGYKGTVFSSDLSVSYHGVSLFAGSKYSSISTRVMDASSDINDVIPYGGASFKSDSISANINYSRVVSDSYRNNSSLFSLNANASLNSIIINSINVDLSSASLPAPFLFYGFSSNHFAWKNAFSDFTVVNNASLSLTAFNKSVILSGAFSSYKNRYFLNESSVPVMSISNESVSSISLAIFKSFGEIYFSGIGSLNSSDSKYLPVPDWQSELRVSWKHNFFKSALKAEFGVSGVYTDSWFAPAYNPALGNYCLQYDVKSEGYPVLNVFANLGIASATLFLKMERVNYGFSDPAYYLHPGYPAPPRTIKFGVFWNLKN
jgi:Putative porin